LILRWDQDAKTWTEETTDAPANSNDEVDLGLGRDVEVTRCPCSTLQSDLILLLAEILFHVGLRALEDDLSLGLSSLKIRELDMSSTECFQNGNKMK
jgi:nitrate reductase gamma subunit